MKKTFILPLLLLGLTACKQSGQPVSSPAATDSTATRATADTTATEPKAEAAEDSPATLTVDFIMKTVKPGQQLDNKALEKSLEDMQLASIQAERYISDADFGGDSPAISYVFGRDVEWKNWKFQPTAPDYFGTHFNFFFDDSRKTGTVKQFAIITSDADWYQQFMADAKAAGLTYSADLDKDVYEKAGKEYQLKTGDATYYYINDFSANGKYDVEMGYETGIDM